jgi:hypothetical protein
MPTPEDTLFEKLRSLDEVKPTAPTEGSPEERVVAPTQDYSQPVTLRNLFIRPNTHPVVLDFSLLRAFGSDWYRWEPETVREEISQEFSTGVSEICWQKIRALQALHSSTGPWTRWQIFEKVAHALNGNHLPNFRIMQMLSLEELYGAVDALDFLRREKFSDEVRLYMAATVLEENVFYVPPPLDFMQLELSQPHYRCQDCGNEESALFHDGFCSNCTDRLHPLQGLSLQPRQELVNAGKGKNLDLIVKFDPTPIVKRWKEVEKLPFVEFHPDEESMEDMQVSKLLLARDYMNIRRKQLAEQLTTLKSWLGAT